MRKAAIVLYCAILGVPATLNAKLLVDDLAHDVGLQEKSYHALRVVDKIAEHTQSEDRAGVVHQFAHFICFGALDYGVPKAGTAHRVSKTPANGAQTQSIYGAMVRVITQTHDDDTLSLYECLSAIQSALHEDEQHLKGHIQGAMMLCALAQEYVHGEVLKHEDPDQSIYAMAADRLNIPDRAETYARSHKRIGFDPFSTVVHRNEVVYTGSARLKNNKRVYFGLEPIRDDRTEDNWKKFAQHSKNYLNYFTDPKISDPCFSLASAVCEKWKNTSDESLQGIRNSFVEGISVHTEGYKKDGSTYVCYASSKPILQAYSHALEINNLDDYQKAYGNILMYMRCYDFVDTTVYNNRGIFRGLVDLIENQYPQISLIFHGFSGDVFKNFFKKTHMTVTPLSKMLELMQKNLAHDAILTGDAIPQDLNHFEGRYESAATDCVIKIDALREMYIQMA